ncbi:preprotein translocase subunit YajC [Dermatophilaceae bacterium Sec6.4]|nr:preprotein translocase subunit YajC [Actinomycetota bacterium]
MPVFVTANSGNSGSGSSTYVLIGLVILMGALLFISNRRKRRAASQQQESLKVGSQVSTTSGMLGTLVEIDDRIATVEVSPGVRMQFIRRAVVPRATLLPEDAAQSGNTAVVADADSGARDPYELDTDEFRERGDDRTGA